MGLGNRILDSPTGRAAVAHAASGYIRLAHLTNRWEVVGGDNPGRYWRAGTPFIGACWHGRLMMMPVGWDRDTVLRVLISEHRDGRLIARTIRNFGLHTIVGSTRKRGTAALRAAVRALAAGDCVGFTPDGPRGPRMRAGAGVVTAARLSGAPIVPAAFAASRRLVAGSWDRMVVPLPFGRIVFAWGEPIHVPRDAADLEPYRRQVEERLNAITAEADALVGQPRMEPAPLAPAKSGAAARGR